MVLVMSVEPGFGGQSFLPESPQKIRALRDEIDRLGLETKIEVDGGINEKTAPLCIEAGVDILVAGSAVFGSADRRAKIDALRG
jgi:ribulose-phosphate 3-epimerase